MIALVRIKGATRQRGLELRLRDLGKIWVSGFGPSEPAAANAAPYASEGPHPSPAASPAIVEEPRARTESRCASEERRAAVACVTVGRGHAQFAANGKLNFRGLLKYNFVRL